MTDSDDARFVRTLATLGMAIAAPVALVGTIFTVVTTPNGVSRPALTITAIAIVILAMSTVVYLADDIKHRFTKP